MARVLCVHGVGQQGKGEDTLRGEWALALRDGMRLAGCGEADLPGAEEIRCVFYVLRGCVPAGRAAAGRG
jgi:hypothetical protein